MPQHSCENAESRGSDLESDGCARKPVRDGFSDKRRTLTISNVRDYLKTSMFPICPEMVRLVWEVQSVRVMTVMANSKFGGKIGFQSLSL
jgi:hypothetical protein